MEKLVDAACRCSGASVGYDVGNSMHTALSRTSIANGIRLSLPVALSVFAYGVVYGVLASQKGLTAWQAALMSGVVFAGSAQFVILDMWMHPLPLAAIAVTTLAVNLRHVLMGTALHPWLCEVPPSRAYGLLFFLNDESWARTLSRLHAEQDDPRDLCKAGSRPFQAACSFP